MPVAPVGTLDEDVLTLDVGNVGEDGLGVDIQVVRPCVVAPADVDAHLLPGHVGKRGVERLYIERTDGVEVLVRVRVRLRLSVRVRP